MRNRNLAVIAAIMAVVTCGVNAQCFNCTYSNGGQGTMEYGQAGCADPFIASGIDKITCNGKCTKTNMEMRLDGAQPAVFTIMRGCSPHGAPCVEGAQSLPNNSTALQFCCTGSLCNGQDRGRHSVSLVPLALVTSAVIFY